MCLSAQVSFAASVFLVGGGTAITIIAARKNWRYVPMAVMPLFAGLQQFMEGNVWLGMTGDNPFQVLWGALGFIFFTWFMRPIWVPLSMYVIEPADSPRKQLFLIFVLIGLAFGVLPYVQHGMHPEMVVVEINNQSLAYEKSIWLDYLMPRTLTNVIYAGLIIVPPRLVPLPASAAFRADTGGCCGDRYDFVDLRIYFVFLPSCRTGDAPPCLYHSDQ